VKLIKLNVLNLQRRLLTSIEVSARENLRRRETNQKMETTH
jgi:hypothetical protein